MTDRVEQSDSGPPRDFRGYGAPPPHPPWPDEARIAININLNFEAGGERSLLEGDNTSENMLTDTGFPAYPRMRSQIVDEATERSHIKHAYESIVRLTGQPPAGWMTGHPGPNTRRLLVEHGGLLYDRDSLNDELPHWVRVAGQSHLVIPYSYETNDNPYDHNGFGTAADFEHCMIDCFDMLYTEGATAPKLMSVGLHDRLVGRPARAVGSVRFLEHAARHDGVWFYTGRDIAEHWRRVHPAPAKGSEFGSPTASRSWTFLRHATPVPTSLAIGGGSVRQPNSFTSGAAQKAGEMHLFRLRANRAAVRAEARAINGSAAPIRGSRSRQTLAASRGLECLIWRDSTPPRCSSLPLGTRHANLMRCSCC